MAKVCTCSTVPPSLREAVMPVPLSVWVADLGLDGGIAGPALDHLVNIRLPRRKGRRRI